MPILLQINVTANWGSTGKIAEQIGLCAQKHGWESYIAYGRMMNPSKNQLIKVGNQFDIYLHYAFNRFMDSEGLGSICATKKLLKEIDRIQPDVIHLHNIHDHYLNYPALFRYLVQKNIPVVWTQHDLWATTGHCAFSIDGCERWKSGCYDCPAISRYCLDNSKRNFDLKKNLFTSVKNMTIVPVSEWLGTQVQQSYLGKYPFRVIKNGVDINVFKPNKGNIVEKYSLEGKHVVLAVSSVWPKFKGLDDFISLSGLLSDDYRIVVVGVKKDQISKLTSNMIGIERTDSQMELAQLYSAANIVMSLSSFETFGLTIAEGMACGTPAIVYGNAALPELITSETGRVVESGNLQKLHDTILYMIDNEFKYHHSSDCRKRAEEVFDKNKAWESYIALYDSILNQTGGAKIVLIGVAAVWNDRKGLDDYIKLASILPDEYVIILVGLTHEQQNNLPKNIIGIHRTHNQHELSQLYSMADILLSLSSGETFGMTMAEAYACGTPCIVYDNTAQPEIVSHKTGRIVKTGDIESVARTIIDMTNNGFKLKHTCDCRLRAAELYNKDKCFEKYIELYESLLK